MTQSHVLRGTGPVDERRKNHLWPLAAAAAGACGVVATLVADVGPLAVVLLLVTAAHWHRRVEGRVPGSTAVRLVPLGLVASAAVLAHDVGAAAGWSGVAVAAGAVAWMALRERTVSRWIGLLSVLPVLTMSLEVAGVDLPALVALVGPLWLVAAGLGLAWGRSTIMR